jgi:hypothetical protein
VCVAVDVPKESDKDPRAVFLRKLNEMAAAKYKTYIVVNSILVATASGDCIAATVSSGSSNGIFEDGWKRWAKLPDQETKPGAVQVEKLKAKPYPELPPKGLALRVYARVLERDANGDWSRPRTKTLLIGKRDVVPAEPGRDHCWLQESEWKALLRANPRKGGSFPLPGPIADRIVRYHLLDVYNGPNTNWPPRSFTKKLTVTVEEVSPDEVSLRLQGNAHRGPGCYDPPEGKGTDWSFHGRMKYDPSKMIIHRFDVVAVCESGAVGTDKGATLGIAFELARGDAPGDSYLPNPIRHIGEGYFK